MNYDYVIKVLLIGSSGVGKSSISNQFVESKFEQLNVQTIGIDLRIKKINCLGKIIKIQLWDTAGHERFRTLTSSYYRGADCVILVFDLSRKTTFDDLPFWIGEIKKYSPKNIEYFLVGNKTDLSKRNITSQEIEIFITSNKINNYMEVSAKTNLNIDELFKKIATDVYTKNMLNYKQNSFEKPIKPSNFFSKTKKHKICCE